MSIGARSQSAKTYLEKHLAEFAECECGCPSRQNPIIILLLGSLEKLIQHGLHALRETLQQDKELTINNTEHRMGHDEELN